MACLRSMSLIKDKLLNRKLFRIKRANGQILSRQTQISFEMIFEVMLISSMKSGDQA